MNADEQEISAETKDCLGRTVVFSLTTTGLKPNPDHILSIAAYEVINGKFSGKQFECHLRPRVQISKGATKVHGLDDSFYEDYYFDCYDYDKSNIISFLEFASDSKLVAYNAQFDRSFLNYELQYWGFDEIPNSSFICCMRMFRLTISRIDSNVKGNYSIKKSSEYLGIKSLKEDYQTALFNAFICARIMIRLMNLVLKQPVAKPSGENQYPRKKENQLICFKSKDPQPPEIIKNQKVEQNIFEFSKEKPSKDRNFNFKEMKSVMTSLISEASNSSDKKASENKFIK